MVISLKDDHVSAWQATYDGAKLLGGETRFLLGGSGHNAGVINPPAANKHGYWTNAAMPDDGRAWLETRDPPRRLAGGRNGRPGWSATAASEGEGAKAAREVEGIEPAPGSYVADALRG